MAADAGVDDETIAKALGSVDRRFIEPSAALWKAIWKPRSTRSQRPGGERKLTGKQEALLVATACSDPPKGRKRWTLELLAGEMAKLTVYDGLSRETISPALGFRK